ncbi:glycosyltransferase family A protein [Agromyces sp. Marseille-P2726]|uniref:glycosyltransferase family A protein n=1 Tax=Agromyces sp. Marseille-P2726 TaxID=2709132 RepID=UPI00156E48C7|nr:glycosyltransferase family 2 protein [Agromyces sp. Marseille-P2726]
MTRSARRWSGEWGRVLPPEEDVEVDVLIPTVGRIPELAATLAGLAAQDAPRFGVIIGDQSSDAATARHPVIASLLRVLEAEGHPVSVLPHTERRGLAEHRQFLLDRASAPAVLFLDDDVWLEPGALERMHDALRELGCGFVGQAVQGLSYLPDRRDHEARSFELWDGPVNPERIRPDSPEFERWRLHNAANLAHVASRLEVPDGGWRAYRIAWVGACVLFDRRALVECGGFGFWRDLPTDHAGEDVVAQWRVMERYGGAGLVPSGAVHLESPTTVTDRRTEASRALRV